MAGIFGSFMRGLDTARTHAAQDEDREFQRGEREYTRSRRGVLDAREDTTWKEGREDRERTIERDKKEYPIRFKMLERQGDLTKIAFDDAEFNAGRRKLLAEQNDALHGERIASSRQNRNIAASNHSFQSKLQKINLSEAEFQQAQLKVQRKSAPVIARFSMDGNPEPVVKLWEDITGEKGSLAQNDDGSYTMFDENGKKVHDFKSRYEVANFATTVIMDPALMADMMIQSLPASRNAGRRGQTPSTLEREYEFVQSQVPPLEGESDEEYDMRVMARYNELKGRPDSSTASDRRFQGVVENILKSQFSQDFDAAVDTAERIGSLRAPNNRQVGAGAQQPAATSASQTPVPDDFDPKTLPGYGERVPGSPFKIGDKITDRNGNKFLVTHKGLVPRS